MEDDPGGHGRTGGQDLSQAAFDDLLREVLARVDGVLDEQARLRHLLDAVVGVAADLSLDGVLDRILSAARALAGAQYAALGVLSPGPQRHIRTFVHQGMDERTVADVGDLPTGHGLLGLLIEDPRPLRLAHLSEHPASYGFPAHHPPMSSFLGVPVRIRERVFGNLYLTEKIDGTEFTEHDEAVVVALAAAAGVAIENAQLYQEAAHRQAWLTATAEITSMLADDTSTQSALQVVADRARSVSGADVAWLVLGSDPADLRLEVASGAPADMDDMHHLSMERSLASTVVRTGRPEVVMDVSSDPRAVDPSSIPGWPVLGPVMVLPLRSGQGVEGVLSLAWTKENAAGFHRVDAALPASFAEQATLALQVARSRDDRQRLALYEDRDRIGRDLHDTTIQQLFAVGLGLQGTFNACSEPQVRDRIERAIMDLDDTVKDIRRTIFALGVLDTSHDIQSEVERVVDRAGATMKLRPVFRVDGPLRSAVGAELAPDLLAVLSEALTNVSRHAHASTVAVRIAVDVDELALTVSDDGIGMDPVHLESGLANMRSRARRLGGDMVVDSRAGAGTCVTWTVPLAAPRHDPTAG
ncbi:diguanylate cyclase [Nocardioides sp. Root122]|uniref:sensor histidine kinase n=1 Tax=Nocardioides TaxID=1839 RepID=UPI0007035367|nr:MULTISPECIES: GAF domain-containing protein [Nocardioides]KQV69574.1 diguanylate cyclase [Nocardioides sp. Root122]MCK9824500.1 GAF domain-containing protein [Nocardioides cavernae]